MDDLEIAIRQFEPESGEWLPLERLLERAFELDDPTVYYDAIFTLFARFPEDDGAGVFWSAVHGMEAVGGYDALLLQSFRRKPSEMSRIMLRRIHNSGQTYIGATEILSLL